MSIEHENNLDIKEKNEIKKLNKGRLKFLATVGTYLLFIAAIVFFVILKFGLTYNITKVMPYFRTTLYSEPNFYQYDLDTLNNAKSQLESHYNKVKNEEYQEKDYYEEGMRGILKYNLNHLNSAIEKLHIATFNEAYATLSEAPYLSYVTDPMFKYNEKTHSNILNMSFDFANAEDRGLYYDIPCLIYEPFIVNKASFSELPMNATMSIIEFNPYVEEGLMVTDFVKKDNAYMEYKVLAKDEEENIHEIILPVILEEYNNDFYVAYENNTMRMTPGPSGYLRVMKETYVAYTTDFLFTSALKVLDDKWNNRNNPYFKIDEVIETAKKMEEQDPHDIAMNTLVTAPYFNYILYDEKGYITDIAFLGATKPNENG